MLVHMLFVLNTCTSSIRDIRQGAAKSPWRRCPEPLKPHRAEPNLHLKSPQLGLPRSGSPKMVLSVEITSCDGLYAAFYPTFGAINPQQLLKFEHLGVGRYTNYNDHRYILMAPIGAQERFMGPVNIRMGSARCIWGCMR